MFRSHYAAPFSIHYTRGFVQHRSSSPINMASNQQRLSKMGTVLPTFQDNEVWSHARSRICREIRSRPYLVGPFRKVTSTALLALIFFLAGLKLSRSRKSTQKLSQELHKYMDRTHRNTPPNCDRPRPIV